MLSEAKHLDLFCLGNRSKIAQSFFSRDCGIGERGRGEERRWVWVRGVGSGMGVML